MKEVPVAEIEYRYQRDLTAWRSVVCVVVVVFGVVVVVADAADET